MTKQDSEKLILSDSVAQLALSKDYLLEEYIKENQGVYNHIKL